MNAMKKSWKVEFFDQLALLIFSSPSNFIVSLSATRNSTDSYNSRVRCQGYFLTSSQVISGMEEDLEVVTRLHGDVRDLGWRGLSPNIFRLISRMASAAVTGFFALAGAFLGVLSGALAGKASDTGIIRGASLGAIAGAVLAIEVLEAYHAYQRSDPSNSRNTYDARRHRADFVEELFYDRFVPHQFSSARLMAYHWQVRDISGDVASKGLSGDLLIKLPSYVIPHDKRDGHEESTCCTICLQIRFYKYIILRCSFRISWEGRL